MYDKGDQWRIIINREVGSERLLASFDDLDEAMEVAEKAYHSPGKYPVAPQTNQWQKAKKDYNAAPSYYLRTSKTVYSVKRAKSGKWFVTTPAGGSITQWFDTAQQAMGSVKLIG